MGCRMLFRRLPYVLMGHALLVGIQYSRTSPIAASRQGRSLTQSLIKRHSESSTFLDGIPTLQRLKAEGRLQDSLGEPVTIWGSSTRIHKVPSMLSVVHKIMRKSVRHSLL